MKFSDIVEAIRSGTMTLDLAGHRTNATKERFLKDYEKTVAMANGKNDGKWSNRENESVEEVDAGMRDHYRQKIEFELDQEKPVSSLTDNREYCFGCGEKLNWTLTGDKLQLRSHWQENPGSRWGGDIVNYPADYVCPFATPQPTKGEIKVASRLLFANFFSEFDDSPKDKEYSDEWSLCCLAGRKLITEYKARQNVAYGQMSNMSVAIYVNEPKDSIIVGSGYHPAEHQEFESDKEYYEALDKPPYPGYQQVGRIIHLAVWRWEATDLNTVGPNNYEKIAKDNDLVEIEVPHGTWHFEHYYDTETNGNKFIYAKLELVK